MTRRMHRGADSGDNDMRRAMTILATAVALAAFAAPVAAAAPIRTVQTIPTYSLEDALADYSAFGEGFADCGEFAILATFAGTVTVTDWGDRMLRHVSYTGRFYNASDLSRSAGRIGLTSTWREFDDEGNWTEVHIHGVQNIAVLDDGRRIAIDVGYSAFSFLTEEELASAGPKGDVAELCEALA